MYINCKIIFYSCIKIFTSLSFRVLNEFGFEHFLIGLGFWTIFSRIFRFRSVKYNSSRVGLKFKLDAFWHIPKVIFILECIKLAATVIKKMWNRIRLSIFKKRANYPSQNAVANVDFLNQIFRSDRSKKSSWNIIWM